MFKAAVFICMLGLGFFSQAQTNFIHTFSSNTNGHYTSSAAAGGEVRLRDPWGGSNFTLNTMTDRYFAVKFIGAAPLGPNDQDYIDNGGSVDGEVHTVCEVYFAPLPAQATAKNSVDLKIEHKTYGYYTTAAGNEVYYVKLDTLDDGSPQFGIEGWRQLMEAEYGDVTLSNFQFKYKGGSQAVNLAVDWMGFFETVADIEAYAATADDGTGDNDEVIGTDAKLSNLTMDGTTIPGFSENVFSYDIVLPEGTTTPPTIAGTLSDQNATITATTQASNLPGTATIEVTAADGNTTQTHTVNFTAYDRTHDQLLITFSDADQNAKLDLESGSFETIDGHFMAAGYEESTGNFRQDFQYGFIDGTNETLTLNPIRDKYLAVKFIGALQGGFTLDQTPFDVYVDLKHTAVSSDVSFAGSIDANDYPLTDYNYTTANGNVVIYVPIDSLGNTSWADFSLDAQNGVNGGDPESSYDVWVNRIEFKFRHASEAFDWNIDFVGFFTTVADIEAAANGMDDGHGDFDEAVTWDGANWSASVTEDVPATLNANYTGAGFTCAALNVGTSDLSITSGTLDVKGDLAGSGAVNIASGASLLTYEGMNVANVTLNRNTNGSALGYSFVGSPVVSDPAITGANLGSTVYSYDETQAYSAEGGARWANAAATQLQAGVGYAQAGQSSISLTGTPNSGNVTVAGLTYSAGTASEQGWNLLSNPYAAAISTQAFIDANTNLDAAIYLWDDKNDGSQGTNSDYLTVTNLGAVAAGPNGGSYNGNIGAMQGFFVKVAAQGTADVTFTEAMRVSGHNDDASFFRKADAHELNLKLALTSADGSLYNETLIGLREDATLANDRGYDAAKLFGNSDIALYSLMDDQPMAIQGLPVVEGTSTELAFNLSVDTELTLSVAALTGLTDDFTFTLTDLQTGKNYNLSEVQNITFQATKGNNQNRFRLTYGTKSILAADKALHTVFKTLEDRIELSFGKEVSVQGYVLYDLSGSVLSQNELTLQTKQLIIPVQNEGIKILKVFTADGQITRKFLF
ncbi:hypothetical protein C7460_11092 [Marinoscillum furvescens DSM 4134]|uniref:Secreted protein (Por secretion system target) n=1 Tax=Marinoscillum furvescens DSM 4134 TaxID=1122208 RepID=A0A3D9L477_MARFU|nr:hypothetical protein C7460_11092 [Marinoscillum furvescens DSM 4134]